MNHYISGIIKIVLLEASVALLLIDRLLGDRFLDARRKAFGLLAGTMVFAWANYGELRGGVSSGFVLALIPVILLAAWFIEAGFGDGVTREMKSFRAWATRTFNRPTAGRWVAIGLASALVLSWAGLGLRTRSNLLVHPWEQFHFYLGAKYQRELGYFNLYKAAILADSESPSGALAELSTTRDLKTFDEVSVNAALSDAKEVRARFSDDRWAAFKSDWRKMAQIWRINWAQVMNDHGNSNSPAWSLLAHPLSMLVPISAEGQAALGWVDMLLMLAMWIFLWQTFGHRVAAVGLLVWAAPPIVFDYLSGSFLRWDWLFAVGMAAGFLKRKRYAVAGGFLGYAVASKLFPLFFGVALGLRALLEWRKTGRVKREYLRFLGGAVLIGALAVGLSAALFGPSIWAEYAQRIHVAQVEKFYSIQYSLKSVYLQFMASEPREWAQGIFPADLKQPHADIEIADFEFGFWFARLLFTALIALLIRRADDVEAFLFGPLLVFTWLTVNMYYWNMLGLLAIGLMTRKERPLFGMLLGLHGIFMIFYLYQHLNRALTEGYAVAWMMSLLIAGAALWSTRSMRSGEAAHTTPGP